MPNLVATTEHELRSLDLLKANWDGRFKLGLHQTTGEPQRTWDISRITPAVFSGYTGPIPLIAWLPSALVGEVAVTKAALTGWFHSGGPVAGYVCGYYVIDGSGRLRWVYVQEPPYPLMNTAGQLYSVRPAFSLWSWFPQL